MVVDMSAIGIGRLTGSGNQKNSRGQGVQLQLYKAVYMKAKIKERGLSTTISELVESNKEEFDEDGAKCSRDHK